ncbi:hypothetical protein ACH419_39390 [Streptomyces bobili]|uniref:hypothetical protein n=1 Tax=Streptomyces bobili TaxID=67280 RepID=UPI0037AF5174
MKLFFIRTDPVQEIAAERSTLDLLRDVLSQKVAQPPASPDSLTAACGWPLVYDEKLAPGVVHCRPSRPDAVEPPTIAEVEAYFQTLTRPTQP